MIRMRVEGVSQLAANLQSLSTRLSRQIMREALRKAGEPMRARAESAAPRRPGPPDLADNIVMSNARPSDGSVAIVVGPAFGFFYAYFQEFGTGHHAAQSFLRPAFHGHVEQAINTVKGEIWRELVSRGFSTRGGGGGGGLE